jgi:hypothetical protein
MNNFTFCERQKSLSGILTDKDRNNFPTGEIGCTKEAVATDI